MYATQAKSEVTQFPDKEGEFKADNLQPIIDQLNGNRKGKFVEKKSSYGRSIDYITKRGIKLWKSIKGKTKTVFSNGYLKAIDHITADQLLPKVLDDKKESPPSKTDCINFIELLKWKKSDTKWI